MTLLLSLLMIFLLCSCSIPPTKSVGNSEVTPSPVIAEASPTPDTTELQRKLIEDSYNQWKYEYPNTPWFYTITDLDHNGRLEVIAASLQGTGLFTYAEYWEVNESLDGLVHCSTELTEGDFLPDIITDTADCYYDPATNSYFYIFEDFARNGASEHFTGIEALCLKDGVIKKRPIASKYEQWIDGTAVPPVFSDQDGKVITENDYLTAVGNTFSGLQKQTVSFEWIQSETVPTAAPIMTPSPKASEPEPEIPENAASYVPIGSVLDPAIVITKNPTSESMNIGGKTWFIAHADNAQSIAWLMVDVSGNSHSLQETMALNQGLLLEALDGDTLAVSNVPASLNGWSVLARFDSSAGSAYTEPASVYVGDFMGLYSSVINAYKTAYLNNTLTSEYAFNNGISEYIGYSQHVGYALKDLDKNGTPELIIAGTGAENHSNNVLYSLYTLSGNVPVKLCESQARDRYYLLPDSRIFEEGSGGAAYSTLEFYRVKDSALVFQEGYSTYNSSDFSGSTVYHSITPLLDPDGPAGNYDNYDSTLPTENLWNLVSTFESSTWFPPMTQIA